MGGVVEGMGWHEAQAIGVKCAARTRYPHCHLVKVVKRKSTVAEATTVAQAWLRLYNTLMGAGYTTSDFWEAVRSRVPEMGECPGIAADADDDSPPEWLAQLGTITREELLERCGLRDEQLEAPFEKDLADRQSAYQTKQGMLPDAARARVLQDLAAERARREARVLQQRPVVPAAWEPAGGGPAGAAASVAVRGELAGATAVVDLSGDGALGGCAPMRGPWGGAVPDAVGGERKRAAVAMLADSGGEGGGVAGGPGEGAGAAGVGGEPAGEDAAMIQAEIVAAVEEGDEVVAAQWLAELGAGAAAAFTRERKGEAMRRRDMVAAKRWLRLSTGTKTRAPAGARASPPLPGFVPIKLEGAAVADVGGGGRGGGAAAGGAPGGYMGAGVPALFPVSAGPMPHGGGGRGGGAAAGGAPGGHVVAEVPALLPAPAGVVPYGGMGGVMWPGQVMGGYEAGGGPGVVSGGGMQMPLYPPPLGSMGPGGCGVGLGGGFQWMGGGAGPPSVMSVPGLPAGIAAVPAWPGVGGAAAPAAAQDAVAAAGVAATSGAGGLGGAPPARAAADGEVGAAVGSETPSRPVRRASAPTGSTRLGNRSGSK